MATMRSAWNGTEYFPIVGFHHIEFFVGNALQASIFYQKWFGFQPYAYSGPQTGHHDAISYVLKQNDAFLVLTAPLNPSHPAHEWLKKHGDGVYDVAIQVVDSYAAAESCRTRGAKIKTPAHDQTDQHGCYRSASIEMSSTVIHSLVDPSDYSGCWQPGFNPIETKNSAPSPSGLIDSIDHVVTNVDWNEMDPLVDEYQRIFGFDPFISFDSGDISTPYSALHSKVIRSRNWKVKLPINEPAIGKKPSQIEEYIQEYAGPGVQHVAFLTKDIISCIKTLRANGVSFLNIPESYYEDLSNRIGPIKEPIADLKNLGILADRDEEGYLLQLFTKPLEDRPTLFFEIIQRAGAQSFGQGNFQALFEAIEGEQAQRGNW